MEQKPDPKTDGYDEVLSPDWKKERETWENERYDRLSKRVAKLEKRGAILESATDEKLYLWIFGAYVFFGFVLPWVTEFFKSGKASIPTLKE
jgi:hypothetical protein